MKPFQLIFNYARRYKLPLVVTSLSMLALVGVQLLIPWLIKLLVAKGVTARVGSSSETYSIAALLYLVMTLGLALLVRWAEQYLEIK